VHIVSSFKQGVSLLTLFISLTYASAAVEASIKLSPIATNVHVSDPPLTI
jgi:hypothetical protein